MFPLRARACPRNRIPGGGSEGGSTQPSSCGGPPLNSNCGPPPSLLEHGADAAVDPEGDAGEPLGLVGGEIDDAVGDVVGLPEAQGMHLYERLVLARLP